MQLHNTTMHLPGCGHGLHRSQALTHVLSFSKASCISQTILNLTLSPYPRASNLCSNSTFLPLGFKALGFRDRRVKWVCMSTTSGLALGEREKEGEERGVEKPGHVAVMLKEVVTHFEGRQMRSFVDCTLGAGGHASAMIKEHPELQTFIGLDVDPVAHKEATPRLQARPSNLKLHLVRTNFQNIRKAVANIDMKLATEGVDGILMDLGMSSMQVNTAERGFSFMKEGPADMRMDPSASLRADEVLNKWPEAEVARILRDYGEERRWRQLARKIVEQRLAGGIQTTAHLVELIGGSNFGRQGNRKAVHPATRTFQALRIAVNDELRTLELALTEAYTALAPKGRLAVISFHSLEDRIVKHFFLNAAGIGRGNEEEEPENDFVVAPAYLHIPGETRHSKFTRKKSLNDGRDSAYLSDKNVLIGNSGVILTKRPVVAKADETNTNPRSRSAKLRVIEKL